VRLAKGAARRAEPEPGAACGGNWRCWPAAAQGPVPARCPPEGILPQTTALAAEVRHISHGLHPAALTQLGLWSR